MQLKDLESYEIIEEREIKDLKSNGVLLRHKKTGARVAILQNDDNNKVFSIAFRTPLKDSTGVAHINEHSVLCGSKKYPVKDPFKELVKGSLNTFLNAMTYPDKTVYPVASINDQDFQNIMDVYLDAVFYPRIYTNKKIFLQEGWHYEMESPEDELKINGVVYNEMKGVISSPEDILEYLQLSSLFPDNTYGQNYGGDPDVIPTLKYEDYLEFHKTYYHPSNSYIYLYGNMDMAEKLNYIDKEYLSNFDKLEVDSKILPQKPFEKQVRIEKEFAISEDMEEEESGYLNLNMVVGGSLDKELNLAFEIIDYALCSAPGAPLKEALLEAGIGKDVYSDYQSGIYEPYFSIVSSDCDVQKEEEFLKIVQENLEKVVKEGFSKNALLAAINHYEFKYREADFGSYPKGLMYGLQAMDSWLYDDTKPFLHIEANETFRSLREKVSTGYYEELVKKYLIDNTHKAMIVMKPVKNLDAKEEEEKKEKLAKLKASMSKEQIDAIIKEYKDLLTYQEKEDSEEDLLKIPMLTRKDISGKARQILLEEREALGHKVLTHPIFTNGIAYFRTIFHLNHIPNRLLPYVGVLKGVLGLMNTANYNYGELFNKMNLETGGMSSTVNVYGDIEKTDSVDVTMELKTKVLYEKIPEAFKLFLEMIETTDYSDEKRLFDILQEIQSRMQGQMISSGHSVAINRAFSYTNVSGELNEMLSGIPFYRFISDIVKDYNHKKQEVISALKELSNLIFCRNFLEADFVGEEKAYGAFASEFEKFVLRMPEIEIKEEGFSIEPIRKNEGFMTSGKVQYVAKVGNFRKAGLDYHGGLRVLKVMMEYEYLWENIRVKNGAYGCMCGFGKSGDSYFVSYRDPHLKKTIETYEGAVEAIEKIHLEPRALDQYIIGAIGDMDTPMNPAAYGLFSMVSYRNHVTQELLDRERKQILNVTEEDIRGLAKYVKAIMEQDYLCVVGASSKIKKAEELFMSIENLM